MSLEFLWIVIFCGGVIAGGICFGVIPVIAHKFSKVDGVLIVDRSNPEKDIYRFNVGNLDELTEKKELRIKVQSNEQTATK